MKKLLTDYKKEMIVIAILLVILISLIGIALIEPKNKDNTNIKENIDTENKEEIKSEENKEEVETENDESIEEPKEEIKEEPKEPTNEEKEEQKTEQTKPNNNTSKPNNTTPDKNETTNNDKVNNESNISNNTGNSTNNSTSDKTETETIKKPVEVTSSNINLNDYDSDIMISKDGTYTLTGTLKYTVYVKGDSKVTLNLNGVTIKSKTDAAIANIDTNELVINLKEGTTNTVSDGIVESSYDGCIFSYGPITLNGTGNLTVNGNQVDGEGIATKNSPITINNGNIKIYTVDDGLNTGGTGGTISVNGGNLFIQSGGDAIDSNKDIIINDGIVTVIGGSAGVSSSLDADDGYEINGGTVLALGTEQIIPPATAKQNTLLLGLNESIASRKLVTLLDSEDNIITSFKVNDKFKTIIISSKELTNGKYYLYTDGVNTGTLVDCVYKEGTYTKGELVSIDTISEFIIEDKITSYIGR